MRTRGRGTRRREGEEAWERGGVEATLINRDPHTHILAPSQKRMEA